MLVPVALGVFQARAEMPPPSVFGVDAPELARLGQFAVGVRTLSLVEQDQPDLLAIDPGGGVAPRRDRKLTVDLWYPATDAPGARKDKYLGSLPSEPPAAPATFTVPGIAVRNARPAGGGYPLVVVSHGYSNATVAMTWLTENLASKGYVGGSYPARRPADHGPEQISGAAIAASARHRLRDRQASRELGGRAPDRCLENGPGWVLDRGLRRVDCRRRDVGSERASHSEGTGVDCSCRMCVARRRAGAIAVKALKAVVAISPAGGGALSAWGADGLKDIHAPLLLIAGNQDLTVSYATGARAFFDMATGSTRYLLTFKQGGHSIGLNAAPEAMRGRLWDQGLVRRSGLEGRAGRCHQCSFHHGVSGSIRQG